jgi:hypothetical protein
MGAPFLALLGRESTKPTVPAFVFVLAFLAVIPAGNLLLSLLLSLFFLLSFPQEICFCRCLCLCSCPCFSCCHSHRESAFVFTFVTPRRGCPILARARVGKRSAARTRARYFDRQLTKRPHPQAVTQSEAVRVIMRTAQSWNLRSFLPLSLRSRRVRMKVAPRRQSWVSPPVLG